MTIVEEWSQHFNEHKKHQAVLVGRISVSASTLDRNSLYRAPLTGTPVNGAHGQGACLVPRTLYQCSEFPSFRLELKDPEVLGLKACWRLFVSLAQLELDLPRSMNDSSHSSSCTTLTPNTLYICINLLHVKQCLQKITKQNRIWNTNYFIGVTLSLCLLTYFSVGGR